jgi:hypothetical protein
MWLRPLARTDAHEGSWRNPLTHLRALATVDDFVAFKLDVDTPVSRRPLRTRFKAAPCAAGWAWLVRSDERVHHHV